MNHYIITGASKGLGRAITEKLAGKNTTLYLISRSSDKNMIQLLSEKGAKVVVYKFDLSNTENIELLASKIFNQIAETTPSGLFLINNAGMLEPVGPIGKYETADYRQNLEVNFTAPALLCHEFIKRSRTFKCKKRILNISSGAALKPYFGWSHYCSTKAGLDMLTKSIHLEHHPEYECAGYNPGRTDTDMQDTIRNKSPEDFPAADSFIKAYEQGNLNAPKAVAHHITELLHSNTFPGGEIITFR